jgi:hypothetical protein
MDKNTSICSDGTETRSTATASRLRKGTLLVSAVKAPLTALMRVGKVVGGEDPFGRRGAWTPVRRW